MKNPHRKKIAALKKKVAEAIKKFDSLPRRDSFSGLHLGGEINRIQQELDRLGDKSKRHYPEITIEIG